MNSEFNYAEDQIAGFVSRRIKELCQKNGMSMYRLHKLTGISESNISNYVSEKTVPTLVTLQRICEAFKITPSQFFSSDNQCTELTEDAQAVARLWSELNLKDRDASFRSMQGLRLLEDAETTSKANNGEL